MLQRQKDDRWFLANHFVLQDERPRGQLPDTVDTVSEHSGEHRPCDDNDISDIDNDDTTVTADTDAEMSDSTTSLQSHTATEDTALSPDRPAAADDAMRPLTNDTFLTTHEVLDLLHDHPQAIRHRSAAREKNNVFCLVENNTMFSVTRGDNAERSMTTAVRELRKIPD